MRRKGSRNTDVRTGVIRNYVKCKKKEENQRWRRTAGARNEIFGHNEQRKKEKIGNKYGDKNG